MGEITVVGYDLFLDNNGLSAILDNKRFKGYEDESKQSWKFRDRASEAESVLMKAVAEVPIGAGFLNIVFIGY